MIKVEVQTGYNDENLPKNLTDFIINTADNLGDKDTKPDTCVDLSLPSEENLKVNARYLSVIKSFVFFSVIIDGQLLLSLHNFQANEREFFPSTISVKTPKGLFINFMFKVEE